MIIHNNSFPNDNENQQSRPLLSNSSTTGPVFVLKSPCLKTLHIGEKRRAYE